MKVNKKILSLLITIISFLIASSVKAVCPVCTVAVAAGVGFSRWIGIDDTITGLWIGGLIVSMIMWTVSWLDKKKINFRGINTITTLGYYILVIAPLYWMDIIGHPFNKIWGMDKLILGIIFGSITFFVGGIWYYRLKAKNNGHAYFPFQKVVMPVSPLIILSIVFYFLTK